MNERTNERKMVGSNDVADCSEKIEHKPNGKRTMEGIWSEENVLDSNQMKIELSAVSATRKMS